MAQSLITFTAVLVSVSSFASATPQHKCGSYGVDFQEGGTYFQNNGSSDPFTAFQYFSGCSNDTANNVLVDPQGNQTPCSSTNMQPNEQTQLITCSNNPKDTMYSGNWSLIVISNNGNQDPIAYQRDFALDVGEQSTTYIYPTVTVSQDSTTVETSTKQAKTTITSTVPETTVTMTHAYSSAVAQQSHGWTEYPHPTYISTTETLHTYTTTFTEWCASTPVHTVDAQCTSQSVPASQDKKAKVAPTILGELDEVAKKVIDSVDDTMEGVFNGMDFGYEASAAYKRAIIAGRQPTEEEKRSFVAERNARLARRAFNLEKRHPDNRTVTSTATQLVTATAAHLQMKTLTNVMTNVDTITTTIRKGTATVYANQSVPVTTTAPAPTSTWTVYQPFVMVQETVYSTYAITNTITTTACGAQASCAARNMFMH